MQTGRKNRIRNMGLRASGLRLAVAGVAMALLFVAGSALGQQPADPPAGADVPVPPAPPTRADLTPPPPPAAPTVAAPPEAPAADADPAGEKPLDSAARGLLKARANAAFAELDQALGLTGYRAPGYKAYHTGQAELQRGEMKIRPTVRLETRIGFLAGEDAQLSRGDLIERAGFAVPRARFGLEGQFADHVPFSVVTDLAGQLLTDAWVGYERFHFTKMYFGARTVPFSRSAILSSSESALSERSRAATAMAPFRQVGVTLAGDYDKIGLHWRLGAYNGFDRVGLFYEGIRNNAGLHGNRIGGISGAARLDLAPLGEIGDSVFDHKGGGLRLNVGGGAYYNDGGSTSTLAYSGDVHLKVGGSHLLLEFLQDATKPFEEPSGTQTLSADVTRRAFVAETGHMFDKLSVALRAELIDPNTDKKDSDDELWLSASVGWHFVRDMLRFQLQYDHRREMNGEPYDNDALYAKMMLRL